MTALPASTASIGLTPKDIFPVLDTVRIIGALAVLTTHTAFWAGSYTAHSVIGPLLARMDVGVALFFVLSGFLLFRPWLARADLGLGGPSVADYYVRRVFRIFPVYLVTAVLALAFVRKNSDLAWTDWLVTFGMLDIYVGEGPPDGLTHTWSLATEVAFYLVLPILAVMAVGRRPSTRRVLGVLAGAVAVNVWWTLEGASILHFPDSTPLGQWLPGLLMWFATGMLLALIDVMRRSEQLTLPGWAAMTIRIGEHPGACWAVALGLILVASTPVAGPTMFDAPSPGEVLTKTILYALIGGLIVATGVFTTAPSTYSLVMSAPLLRHLGHISYGVFCLHIPVLHLIMWGTGYSLFDGNFVELWLLACLGSLLAAEAAYRWVELPGMRVGRRVAALIRTKPRTVTTTR